MARGNKTAAKGKGKDVIIVSEKHGVKPRFIPNTIEKTLDRVMSVQRPVVLAHLNGLRAKHPDASPAELTAMLERRYLAAVTASGTATGAAAVIPAVGTVTALALSGAETVAFLEATALFAQSLSELHGIAVDDPERARALVLAMMLGREGSQIIKQWGLEALNEDMTRNSYWGEIVANQVPQAIVGPLLNRLKNAFMRRFAARQGAHIIGRALPYGIGAVIGGVGNNLLGRRIVQASRDAFPAPAELVLEPEEASAPRNARSALQG